MIASAGFSQRNITIAAVSLAMGIGFTQVSDIFVAFPELLQNIFVGNSVALTFLSAVILSACLPKDTIIDGPLVHKERSEQEESQEQTESQDNSKPSGEEQESLTVSRQSTKDHQEDSDNKH